MADSIVNAEYIDSRDAIERLAELRDEFREAEEAGDTGAMDSLRDELEWTEDFVSQGEDVAPDWAWGEQFIRDDKFEDHARDLAEDIGAIDRDAIWPLGYIDWPAAADALRMDYSEIDVQGTSYWCRS